MMTTTGMTDTTTMMTTIVTGMTGTTTMMTTMTMTGMIEQGTTKVC